MGSSKFEWIKINKMEFVIERCSLFDVRCVHTRMRKSQEETLQIFLYSCAVSQIDLYVHLDDIPGEM